MTSPSPHRLPMTVQPERYELTLTPDLEAFTFEGKETITVTGETPIVRPRQPIVAIDKIYQLNVFPIIDFVQCNRQFAAAAPLSRRGGSGPDPLFARLFIFGVSANFLPAVLIGEPIEVGVIAAVHLALIYRIRMAGVAAGRQRAEDLERYQQLRREPT